MVFAIDGLGEAVLELVLEDVGAAVDGRLDKFGSAVYAAERPVTLVQSDGGVPVPATKFTAAHCIARQ